MATLVASMAASGVQPRAVHAGVNSVYAIYSLSASISGGDIIQMCKLPDGARVVSVTLTSPVNISGTSGILNVGTRDDTDRFIASATLSANLVFRINNAAGLGWLNDISDAAAVRNTMVEITVGGASATTTTSGSIALIVEYQMDQLET